MGPYGKVLLNVGFAASYYPQSCFASHPAAARGDLLECALQAGILQQLPTWHFIQEDRISPLLN